eukprot:3787963-Rhodomonas_salina.1
MIIKLVSTKAEPRFCRSCRRATPRNAARETALLAQLARDSRRLVLASARTHAALRLRKLSTRQRQSASRAAACPASAQSVFGPRTPPARPSLV